MSSPRPNDTQSCTRYAIVGLIVSNGSFALVTTDENGPFFG